MSLSKKRWTLCSFGLATLWLAGCGTPASTPSLPSSTDQANRQVLAVKPVVKESTIMSSLNLTAAQKARLAEIKADWPGVNKIELMAAEKELKTILKARVVNQLALKAMLVKSIARLNAKSEKRLSLLEKARDVLTTIQRNRLAALVLVQPEPVTQSNVKLTASQMSAFAWTKAMTKARKMAALKAYFHTGDRMALRQAWLAHVSNPKIEQMVSVLANMTLAQRMILIADMERAHAALMHEHEHMD